MDQEALEVADAKRNPPFVLSGPPKFELGKLYITPGVQEMVARGLNAARLLDRHSHGDWGDLSEDDKQLNEEGLKSGDDRLLSHYKTEQGRVYIITEWDRSVTTILMPEEY